MASSSLPKIKNIRGIVSKKRRRYIQDGFDLDLTYICERIIAMGYPAEHMEAMYRNNMTDVHRMLEKYHHGCYKIYNLCSERKYDHNPFPYYAVYPFKDHNPPDIELISEFCKDVDQHLRANSKNVVAVHCKAGKGRTGTMISCYLLYIGMFQTADEALHHYAKKRTRDAKGVTIPSQRRYVEYYATLLKNNETYQPVQLYICEVRVTGAVNIRAGSINVSGEAPKPLPEFRRTEDTMVAKMDYCMPLSGDVEIEFFKSAVLGKEKLCHFWFNTYFVDRAGRRDADGNLLLTLSKKEIDDAHKNKRNKEFPNNFSVELVFRNVPNGSRYSEIRSNLENNRQVPQPLQHHQQAPPTLSYQNHLAQQQQHQQYQLSIQRSQAGGDPYRAVVMSQQNSGGGGYMGQQLYQQPVRDQDENNHQNQLEYSDTSSSESSTEEEGWDSGECPTQLLETPAKAANLYYRNDNYYYGSCSSSSPSSSGPSSSASHPNPNATTTTKTPTVNCNISASKIRDLSVAESANNSSSSGKLSHNTVDSSNLDQPNTTTSSSSSKSSVKLALVVPESSASSFLSKHPRAGNGKLPAEQLTAVACPSASSSNANASSWPSIGLPRKKKKSFKSASTRNFALVTSSSVASASTKSGKGRFQTFRWLKNMRGDPNLKKVLATSGDIVTLTNGGKPTEEPDPAVPSTPPPTPTIATLSLNAVELFLPSSSENLLSLDYYSSICDKQLSFESPCKSPGHLMKLNLSQRPELPPSEPDCPVVVAKPSERRLKIGFEVTPSPSPTSPQSENPFVVVTTSDSDPKITPIPPTKSHNLVPRSENASFCDRILQTFVAGISPRKSSAEHDLQVPPSTCSSSTHSSPLVARAVSRCSSISLRELGQELQRVIKTPAKSANQANPEQPPKKD